MNWMMFGGSLAAVLALAGVARLLKLGGGDGAIGAPEDALGAAENALPGFVAVAVIVAVDRRAALVSGEDARLAVLKAHGARVAVREIAWTAVRATPAGIVVETRERRFGRITLCGVDALDVRRLAPELTRV